MGASLDPGLLTGLVVGGVGLVVALTHLSGGTSTRELRDEADARSRFADDFPDLAVRSVTIADDRRSALLELQGSDTGLVFVLGADVVTRRLPPGAAVRDEGGGLSLRLRDFGSPGVHVRLGSVEQRELWRRRLEA